MSIDRRPTALRGGAGERGERQRDAHVSCRRLTLSSRGPKRLWDEFNHGAGTSSGRSVKLSRAPGSVTRRSRATRKKHRKQASGTGGAEGGWAMKLSNPRKRLERKPGAAGKRTC
eukprot:4635816-Prymnesium_polylepis.1